MAQWSVRDLRLIGTSLIFYALFAAFASEVLAREKIGPGSAGQSLPASSDAIQAVGLEAQGVDAWTAWRAGKTLDVRDAYNRPVFLHLIERQVKAGWLQAAEAAASASRMPLARLMIRVLDRLSSLARSVRPQVPWFPRESGWAAPRSSRPSVKMLAVTVLALVFPLSGRSLLRWGSATVNPSCCAKVVLRC